MSGAGIEAHFAHIGDDPFRDAFASRRAVLPWRGKRALPPEDVPATFAQLMSGHRTAEPRLAYVHVPFCANHCLFCGFYRNAYEPGVAAAYVDLVVEEMERDASAPAVVQGPPVAAVYFGGGTPSALSAEQLARLIGTVKRCLPLAPDCEITVEGRIIHFDPDKVDACLEAGANRFSIGVQSFDTHVRRRQGRRSGKEEAIRFLEGVRNRGGAALVIDLIYGLPDQTPEVWREDLRIAAAIAPDGVDLYGLNLIPGTPLHRAVGAGKFPAAATLRDLGGMYRTGSEFLAAEGWRQISNSHWARTPLERNLYNLRIKQGVDCLAYGSGAGGTLGRHSYGLAGDLAAYSDAVRSGRKPVDGMRVADPLQPLRNHVTAGLEVGSLDLAAAAMAPATDVRADLDRLLAQWQSAGLIERDGEVLTLSPAGRFWYANLVFAFDALLAGDSGAATPPAAILRSIEKRREGLSA